MESVLSFFSSLVEGSQENPGVYKSGGGLPLAVKFLIQARAGEAFGGSKSPDAVMPKGRGARGYIVSHANGVPDSCLKLVPNTKLKTVMLLKYKSSPTTRSREPSGWLPLTIEDVQSDRQALEVMAWMCIVMNIRAEDVQSCEVLRRAYSGVMKLYENAVKKIKASQDLRRSYMAISRAEAQKEALEAVTHRAAKRVRIAADNVVFGDEAKEDDDETDVQQPRFSTRMGTESDSLRMELERVRRDNELLRQRRNMHAEMAAIMRRRERLHDRLEHLRQQCKEDKNKVPQDLLTTVADCSDDSSASSDSD